MNSMMTKMSGSLLLLGALAAGCQGEVGGSAPTETGATDDAVAGQPGPVPASKSPAAEPEGEEVLVASVGDSAARVGGPTIVVDHFSWQPEETRALNLDGNPLTADNALCALTGYRGSLNLVDHGWEGPFLRTDTGQWTLGSNGGDATASCVPFTAFGAADGHQPTFATFGARGWDGMDSSWMWWSDAISTLSWFEGQFDGGDERVGLWPLADGNSPTGNTFQLQAFATGGGLTGVGGRSTFLGAPVTWTGRFRVSSRGGSVWLNETANNFCFLAAVSGKFRGGDEFARIVARQDSGRRLRWLLEVGSTEDGPISAEAECVAFR